MALKQVLPCTAGSELQELAARGAERGAVSTGFRQSPGNWMYKLKAQRSGNV